MTVLSRHRTVVRCYYQDQYFQMLEQNIKGSAEAVWEIRAMQRCAAERRHHGFRFWLGANTLHYNDGIMSAMASQITSLTIVYSIVYWGADQKTSKLRVTGLCVGNSPVTGEFPAQRTSTAENVSIWWRHRDLNQWYSRKCSKRFHRLIFIRNFLKVRLVKTKGTRIMPWTSVIKHARPVSFNWNISSDKWKYNFSVFQNRTQYRLSNIAKCNRLHCNTVVVLYPICQTSEFTTTCSSRISPDSSPIIV